MRFKSHPNLFAAQRRSYSQLAATDPNRCAGLANNE